MANLFINSETIIGGSVQLYNYTTNGATNIIGVDSYGKIAKLPFIISQNDINNWNSTFNNISNKANVNGSNTTGGLWTIQDIFSPALISSIGNGQVLSSGNNRIYLGNPSLGVITVEGDNINTLQCYTPNNGFGKYWNSFHFTQSNIDLWNSIPANYVPYSGAHTPLNLNNQLLQNTKRIINNGEYLGNGGAHSILNCSTPWGGANGANYSVLIKTSAQDGDMMSFKVMCYGYAHRYIEFQINLYKYINNHHDPTVTWIAGNSNLVEKVQFYVDVNTNLFVNVKFTESFDYQRIAITDVLAYTSSATHNAENWALIMNGSTSGMILNAEKLPIDFKRDNFFNEIYVPYENASRNVNLNSKSLYGVSELIVNHNATINGITYTNNGVFSPSDYRFQTTGGAALRIYGGGVLTSNVFTDASLIPTNGIYSKGQILTGSGFAVIGGTANGFLKANGTIDTNTYLTSANILNKANINGDNTTGGTWQINKIQAPDLTSINKQIFNINQDVIYWGNPTIANSIFETSNVNALVNYVNGVGSAKIWTAHHFTQANINNWNTAFGWGNHATQGYLTTANLQNLATDDLVQNAGVDRVYDYNNGTLVFKGQSGTTLLNTAFNEQYFSAESQSSVSHNILIFGGIEMFTLRNLLNNKHVYINTDGITFTASTFANSLQFATDNSNLKFPNSGTSTRTIPISVNGQFADNQGNITYNEPRDIYLWDNSKPTNYILENNVGIIYISYSDSPNKKLILPEPSNHKGRRIRIKTAYDGGGSGIVELSHSLIAYAPQTNNTINAEVIHHIIYDDMWMQYEGSVIQSDGNNWILIGDYM